jgi:hypothetical protein
LLIPLPEFGDTETTVGALVPVPPVPPLPPEAAVVNDHTEDAAEPAEFFATIFQ